MIFWIDLVVGNWRATGQRVGDLGKHIESSTKYQNGRFKVADNIIAELSEAVQAYDPELAVRVAKKAVEAGVDPIEAIEHGLARGIRIVGEKFERGEVFMPHLVIAAESMKAALQVLRPELEKRKISAKNLGTIILGTVEGDIHDIGKNLVGTMLTVSGFEVIDLGADVPAQRFIDAVRKHGAQVVAASALLTTTRFKQKEIIDALRASGLREKVKVVVGGSAIDERWVEEIGADGYAENAVRAVEVIKGLLI